MILRSAICLLAIVPFATPCAALGSDAAGTINGTWVIESFVLGGKPVEQHNLDRLKETPLVVKDEKIIVGDGGTWIRTAKGLSVSNGGVITFDHSKTPGVVTYEKLGHDGRHGIYTVDGNTPVICWTSQDNPLPAEFKSTPENEWQIRTYTRVKPTTKSDEP